MNIKRASFLTFAGAIALNAFPAYAEENIANNIAFSCEVDNKGIPTTVLEAEGVSQGIFNWDSERLSSEIDVLEECQKVASKLTDYSNEQTGLSDLAFKSHVQIGVPTICATSDPNVCEKTLLTLPLSPTEKAEVVAQNFLTEILNPELQTTETVKKSRGLQSISHSISLAELIFGRKLIKSFN